MTTNLQPLDKDRRKPRRVHKILQDPRSNLQRPMTVHFEGAGRRKEVGADSVGSGIWYGERDAQNAALCTKHDAPSREVGELMQYAGWPKMSQQKTSYTW